MSNYTYAYINYYGKFRVNSEALLKIAEADKRTKNGKLYKRWERAVNELTNIAFILNVELDDILPEK